MKAKDKEKAIEIHTTTLKVGDVSETKTKEKRILAFTEKELHFALDHEGRLPTDEELKSYHYGASEKPNAHMPGGSFSACVLIMEDKGHETESAKKICGALQADAGGKGLTEAETKAVREVTGKALSLPCTCDECGAEDACAPGSACQEPDCDGTMVADKGRKGGPGSGNFGHSGRPGEQGGSGASESSGEATRASKEAEKKPSKATHEHAASAHRTAANAWSRAAGNAPSKEEREQHETRAREHIASEQHHLRESKKSFEPEIKVVRPAPSVKILFAPPTGDMIASKVGEAVERALSRRTGKII
jgi:hypothetical protein